MAAIGLTNPQLQFLDDDAEPLAGGFLYSYLAGSSTPTETYSASTLDPGDANTNPIELDSAGRCVIYLDPANSYKFILKNADLETIWTQDNVSPAELAV